MKVIIETDNNENNWENLEHWWVFTEVDCSGCRNESIGNAMN